MKTNNKQICTLIFKKVKYHLYLSPLYDRALRAHSMLLSQQECFLMQFAVDSPPVFLHRVGNTWIDNDSKRGVGGKISQDGHRGELRLAGTREFNRCAKRTLRLRQIIQGDDDPGEHKETRVN